MQSHATSCNHYPAINQKVTLTQTVFKADVILGSPGSGCMGMGVCQVMRSEQEPSVNMKCPRTKALIRRHEMPDFSVRLQFEFEKAQLAPANLVKHFQWNLFQVTDPYDLPNDIAQELGLNAYRIHPGVYPVVETDYKYILIL